MSQCLLGFIWLLPVMLASNIDFSDCPREHPFVFNRMCPVPDLFVRWRDVEPWMKRIDPGEIGDVKILNLTKGRTHRRITLAQRPALFEVPGFLSDAECKYIITKATLAGMDMSAVIGEDSEVYPDLTEGQDLSEVVRLSYSVGLSTREDRIFQRIKRRIAKATEMPREVVMYNEAVQVARYKPQGHYHSHPDSSDDWMFDNTTTLPCCYQTGETASMNRCHVCRFMTFMIYLKDVEEGGETAFPYAHTPDDEIPEYLTDSVPEDEIPEDWQNNVMEHAPPIENLSTHCYKANLYVRPKKGTAVFWYNHFIDPETGWLGELDPTSLHGGCDVIRGEKWITNFWLNAPNYYNRNLPANPMQI